MSLTEEEKAELHYVMKKASSQVKGHREVIDDLTATLSKAKEDLKFWSSVFEKADKRLAEEDGRLTIYDSHGRVTGKPRDSVSKLTKKQLLNLIRQLEEMDEGEDEDD